MFKDNCFEQFVPECLVKGKTMVFCAGTGAGKTTFANACLEYIPHHLRCISIEDTDEAKFRFHKNHVKLYYPSEGESSTVIPRFSFTFWFSYEPGQNPHD